MSLRWPFGIRDVLGDRCPIVNVIDVGALSLGENSDVYAILMKQGLCNVIGFEPVKEACDQLNQMHQGKPYKYFPFFVGDGKPAKFHLCNFPMTSSLFPPNTSFISKFQNLEELTRVVSTSDVNTMRLDDIPEVGDPDLIKMDVQGAELSVITGGPNTFAKAVVIETEVEFVPMYQGQPLFADVDIALRKQGFVFHKFKGICSRMMKPLTFGGDVNAQGSQQLWGDAIYIRDVITPNQIDDVELSEDKLLRMCVILHEIYASFDLVLHILQFVQSKLPNGPKYGDEYLKLLQSAPMPSK